MAFFKEDDNIEQEEDTILIKTPILGSKISRCMVINGDIVSCESIVVDGRVNGSVISSKSVVLSRGAIIVGKIKAKKVRVDGILEGPIEAEIIEVTSKAKSVGYMIANDIVIEGESDGDILAKNKLLIKKDANVNTIEAKAKDIKIVGTIAGNIVATNFLEIATSGLVKGDIKAKEYLKSGGAKVTGTICRYVGRVKEKDEE